MSLASILASILARFWRDKADFWRDFGMIWRHFCDLISHNYHLWPGPGPTSPSLANYFANYCLFI